jgi:hypothetical protein
MYITIKSLAKLSLRVPNVFSNFSHQTFVNARSEQQKVLQLPIHNVSVELSSVSTLVLPET